MSIGERAAVGDRLVGARIPRVEDPVLLLGRGTYVDDVKLPDVLEVAFVRSPHAHARIRSVDVTAGRALPGVAHVLIGSDAAAMCPGWRGVLAFPGMKAGLQRPLALDRVCFVGEPVVAIAATSRAVAEDAADLVRLEYEPLSPVLDPAAALEPGGAVVHEDLGDNSRGGTRSLPATSTPPSPAAMSSCLGRSAPDATRRRRWSRAAAWRASMRPRAR